MASTQPAPGTLRPGGRTERKRQAVATAALSLLKDGETDLSPARVAAEAGISQSTIYRRWPTRFDLMREALTLHTSALVLPDTGAFESDLHALARTMARFLSDPAEIEMSAAMASNADPDFTRWQVDYFSGRFAEVGSPFALAIERGELSPETDIEMLVEVLIGPMVTRTVVMRQTLTPAWVRRLSDTVIRAARG